MSSLNAEERIQRFRQPDSRLLAFFWRIRLFVRSTFAMSMMEPWEEALVRKYSVQRVERISKPSFVSGHLRYVFWSFPLLRCAVHTTLRFSGTFDRPALFAELCKLP